jgi:hypothetical protein
MQRVSDDRLPLTAAHTHFNRDAPVVLIRRVQVEGHHRCVVDVLPERFAEAEIEHIPLKQAWYGKQEDVTGARILRGKRAMRLLRLLGV